MKLTFAIVAMIAISAISACRETVVIPLSPDGSYYNTPPSSTSPSKPPSTTPSAGQVIVEFRVIGNATSARIRFSNSLDGLTQVTAQLPYLVSFNVTNQSSMFLSLDVTPLGYGFSEFGFVQAQIFVNGILFREASSSNYEYNTISVSGTYRR